MIKSDKYTELEPLIKGASFKQLFDFLHTAYLLRFTNKDQLNRLNNKFGTPKKLAKLVELGFFVFNEAYSITQKTLTILKDESYLTVVKIPDGNFTVHYLDISNFLQKEMEKDDFFTVFYPNFSYLIPDCCLIRKNERGYKIQFVEVENKKPAWIEYLYQKQKLYERLATDRDIYLKWWKKYADRLELPYPKEEDFCFDVAVHPEEVKFGKP